MYLYSTGAYPEDPEDHAQTQSIKPETNRTEPARRLQRRILQQKPPLTSQTAMFEVFPSHCILRIPEEQVFSVFPLFIPPNSFIINPKSLQIHSAQHPLPVPSLSTCSAKLESLPSQAEPPEDQQSIDSADSQASVLYPRVTQSHREYIQSVRD